MERDMRLELPLETRNENPVHGLSFRFLADLPIAPGPVLTGHENGIITIALAEADDAEREARRTSMGEPYRTLLGHFRHEIGHYYWDVLVRDKNEDSFRELFGDERSPTYQEAQKRYYEQGPKPNWEGDFISAYATMHPWEDFAETWAHYFHMVDTLETAAAHGLSVRPQISKGSARLSANIDFDPHGASMDRLVEAWLPLTFAMNSINHSMGLQDLYPFVLTPAVIVKINFVHTRIHALEGWGRGKDGTLEAIVAGLKAGLPRRPD